MVHVRCVVVERLADVEERRLLHEIEADRLHGGLRGLFVLGGDDGDRLALVADVLLGEQGLVGRDPERREVPVLEQRYVLPGDRVDALHRVDPREVEARDVGVVDRRAQCLRPERAGGADVVDVLGAAGDVGDAVVARESCADGLHAGAPGTSTGASSPGCGSQRWDDSISPPAAAATASMIFT